MPHKKTLVSVIPWVFYALLIVFLIVYLIKIDWSVLEGLQIQWVYVAVASIIGLFFRYWGATIWAILLHTLGAHDVRKNIVTLYYVYAKSWLGRYIPGTAPWILGKIYFASKLGVSKNKLAVSALLEGGLQILVTILVVLVILLLERRLSLPSTELWGVFFIAIVAGGVVLMPKVFNWFIGIAYRIVRKKPFPAEHGATPRTIIIGTLLYIVGALLMGVSYFFIAKAVYPSLDYSDALYVIGASNLASALSMLAIFVPGGIGVREGILIAMLSIIMPTEFALVIAVFTRIWSVFIDLLFFVLASFFQRLSNHKNNTVK